VRITHVRSSGRRYVMVACRDALGRLDILHRGGIRAWPLLGFMSSLKGRGRVKGGECPGLSGFPGGWGHAELARGHGGLGLVLACSPVAAMPGERPGRVRDRAEPGRAAMPRR
jgi:hypothetical protein